MYFTLIIFFLGIIVGMFVFYATIILPELSVSLEKLALQSKSIDEMLDAILVKCYADRVLLFQVKNGEYFESGAPLIKLVATNESVNQSKPNIRPIKHVIKGALFQHWGNVISYIIQNKHITLSANNQYENFVESQKALKKRGMGSGVYMKICRKTIVGTRISAILCIEWEGLNPPFDSEYALKLIAENFLHLQKLINEFNETKIHVEKVKKIQNL